MRLALTLEYDGHEFSGWQRQPGRRTVQGCVEEALSSVADHPVGVICAGRTDAGVHARGQVIHFNTQAERPLHAWQLGGNSRLPAAIAIVAVVPVPDDFHARFSTLRRTYVYRICNRRARLAVDRGRHWWVHRELDAVLMTEAAAHLLGEHDFTSFRAAQCQAMQPVRTVYRVDVRQQRQWLSVTVQANAFLHHMVRNLVGALVEVGTGRRAPGWIDELLTARDRSAAAMTAPAHGLEFARVDYPWRYGLEYAATHF